MIFKGNKFRRNKNIVLLPETTDRGYCLFGKIVKEETKGSYLIDYYGKKIYVKPIINHGHSLTNMMYGSETNNEKATHSYLCVDAICYTAKN